jgi:hypothetical protein
MEGYETSCTENQILKYTQLKMTVKLEVMHTQLQKEPQEVIFTEPSIIFVATQQLGAAIPFQTSPANQGSQGQMTGPDVR